MPTFPSLEWFQALRRAANESGALRPLGSCHASVGVKVGDCAYMLEFEGFECAAVERIDADALIHADFYLDMPETEWAALLGDIRDTGRAAPECTFNRLDLAVPGGIVRAHDEYKRNHFLRYHLTLQAFFECAATL